MLEVREDNSKSSDTIQMLKQHREKFIKSSLLQNITCSIHGNSCTGIDANNFSVTCTACRDSSSLVHFIKGDEVEVSDLNISQNHEEIEIEVEDEFPACYQHINQKSSFFCLDCSNSQKS